MEPILNAILVFLILSIAYAVIAGKVRERQQLRELFRATAPPRTRAARPGSGAEGAARADGDRKPPGSPLPADVATSRAARSSLRGV